MLYTFLLPTYVLPTPLQCPPTPGSSVLICLRAPRLALNSRFCLRGLHLVLLWGLRFVLSFHVLPTWVLAGMVTWIVSPELQTKGLRVAKSCRRLHNAYATNRVQIWIFICLVCLSVCLFVCFFLCLLACLFAFLPFLPFLSFLPFLEIFIPSISYLQYSLRTPPACLSQDFRTHSLDKPKLPTKKRCSAVYVCMGL